MTLDDLWLGSLNQFFTVAYESDAVEPDLGMPLIFRVGGPKWGGIGYVVNSALYAEMANHKIGILNTNNAAGALLHAMNMVQQNDSMAVQGMQILAPPNFPTNLLRIVIARHYVGLNQVRA